MSNAECMCDAGSGIVCNDDSCINTPVPEPEPATLIICRFSERPEESHAIHLDSEANNDIFTGTFDQCLDACRDSEANGIRILIRCATGTIQVTDIAQGAGRYIGDERG